MIRGFGAYDQIEEVAERLYRESLIYPPVDVVSTLDALRTSEEGLAREVMDLVVYNVRLAQAQQTLVCQDTGLPIFWVRVGRVSINLERVTRSIRKGVEEATRKWSLRSSVCHPLSRHNPQTNTGVGVPIIHFEAIDEEKECIDIHILPKGSGSENQSFFKMLDPAEGIKGIKKFVLESVIRAGPKGCPPYIVGVGIGGSADLCMWLAKKALFRKLGKPHPEPEIAAMEQELLEETNQFGIGPQGLGGRFTAMAVHIEYAYTHISQNPVSVNLQCWRGLRAGARIYADGRVEALE